MSSFLQTIRAESNVDIEQLPAYHKLGLSKDALAGVMEESDGVIAEIRGFLQGSAIIRARIPGVDGETIIHLGLRQNR